MRQIKLKEWKRRTFKFRAWLFDLFWWIHLHPTYDPEEVKAYIESYNDPA